MHKGFKYLDPAEGRVYISRDVVFDEHVFPFAQLHPNAGARLRSELVLLPDILLNPTGTFGDANILDQTVSPPVPTNPSLSSVQDRGIAGSSGDQNGGENSPYERHFMCPGLGDIPGSGAGTDSATSNSSPGRSPSGSLLGSIAEGTFPSSSSAAGDIDSHGARSSTPSSNSSPTATGSTSSQPDPDHGGGGISVPGSSTDVSPRGTGSSTDVSPGGNPGATDATGSPHDATSPQRPVT